MKKLLLLLLLPILIFAQDTWVNVQFDFDGYADEVTWNLYDSNQTVVASGGDYANGQPDAFHQIESLYSGDYTFELNDSYGDGLGWPPDNLGWCLVYNECQDTLFYAEGDYGLQLIESLTIAPCAPPEPPAIGCMDENATNYDETAEINDSSLCEYPPCGGFISTVVNQQCVGNQVLAYYEWETDANANCNVIKIFYGTDNFNSVYDVNIDNGIWGVYMGSGQMPPNWDEERYFYVEFADGSISDTIYYTPYSCIPGCIDSTVDNYNPWATSGDGSCDIVACESEETEITISLTLDSYPG